MAIPRHAASISIGQVRNEFGGPWTTRLGQYYRGGAYVDQGIYGHPKNVKTLIPASGFMGVGNFHGVAKPIYMTITSTRSITVPAGYTAVTGFMIGGGGAGAGGETNPAHGAGGGGGAGGLVEFTNRAISPGTHTVIVGAGAVRSGYEVTGGNGGDTVFNGLTAYGGGGGGSHRWNGLQGRDGGCGGGGGSHRWTYDTEIINLIKSRHFTVTGDGSSSTPFVWINRQTGAVQFRFGIFTPPTVNNTYEVRTSCGLVVCRIAVVGYTRPPSNPWGSDGSSGA